jgi:diadenosine tetraphosphate (Ap4A) HIT family hydrolase
MFLFSNLTNFLKLPSPHKTMQDCELCKAQHEDYRLLYKDTRCFCIVNIEPLKDGHFMVLPTRHVKDLKDLTGEELKAMHNLFHTLSEVIKQEYGHDALIAVNRGSNTSQEHTHFHILPSNKAFREVFAAAEGLPSRVQPPAGELQRIKERLSKHF